MSNCFDIWWLCVYVELTLIHFIYFKRDADTNLWQVKCKKKKPCMFVLRNLWNLDTKKFSWEVENLYMHVDIAWIACICICICRCIDPHMPSMRKSTEHPPCRGEIIANSKGPGKSVWRPQVPKGKNDLRPHFRRMHRLGTFEKFTVGKNILKN